MKSQVLFRIFATLPRFIYGYIPFITQDGLFWQILLRRFSDSVDGIRFVAVSNAKGCANSILFRSIQFLSFFSGIFRFFFTFSFMTFFFFILLASLTWIAEKMQYVYYCYKLLIRFSAQHF